MGLNPNDLMSNMIALTGAGTTPEQYTQQNIQNQIGQQSVQHNALVNQQDLRQQAQDAQYQSDEADYASNPTPQKTFQLALKYPDKAKALIDAAKAKDDAQTTADQTFFGQIYAAAKNGQTDLVKQNLQARRDAEAKAGGDTSELDAALQAINSGDPNALNHLQATALSQIYAHNPDKFADVMGVDKDKKNQVVHAGDYVLDGDGKVVFKAPDKPEDPAHAGWVQVTNVDHSTQWKRLPGYSGGGGPPGASGGAAVGHVAPGFDNFYSGFLAPTEGGYADRDGMSGAPVNFGINQKANPDINVKDLTQEKAKQLFHDRYWVPSGADKIQDPTLAAIQMDTAVNMGLPAAKRLLQLSGGDPDKYLKMRDSRYRSIGGPDLGNWLNRNNSLRQYVGLQDGKPIPDSATPSDQGPSGDRAAADMDVSNIQQGNIATVPPAARGIVQSIIDGRFPITSRMTSPKVIQYFQMANAVDPTVDATTYVRRAQTAKAIAPGGALGKPLISGKTLIDHLYDLAQASEKLGGSDWTPVNSLHNWYLQKHSDPALSTYNSTLTKVATEQPTFLGKDTIPAESHVRQDYDASNGPGARKAAIAATLNMMDGRFGPILQSYNQGMSKNADLSELIGNDHSAKLDALRQWAAGGELPQIGTLPAGSKLGANAPVQRGGAAAAPVLVHSPAEARALAPGTRFVTSDGRTGTR